LSITTNHRRKGNTVTNTEHTSKASRRATGLFALLGSLLHTQGSGTPKISQGTGASSSTPALLTLATIAASLLASASLTAALPATASAYATLEGPPIFSSAPGLPDGRVYELVSPADDDGNEAGASSLAPSSTGSVPAYEHYSVASAEGDSVFFETTGPMGESSSADILEYVATRTSSGWKTRSALPRPEESEEDVGGALRGKPKYLEMSGDFSHALAVPNGSSLAPLPAEGCASHQRQMYLAGSDPFVPASWLTQPVVPHNTEDCNAQGVPVGGTPDFSTVYFTYAGTLLPEDATRLPHTRKIPNQEETEAWGFYEDSEGVLRDAGLLPNGTLDPFGAVPAASLHRVALMGNQVSANGSRAFFVSPDPASCQENGGENNCAVDPPELYVRENGSSLLVSRDTLLPEADGLPVAAPHGAVPVNYAPIRPEEYKPETPYVFASVDGSQAFFQSEDQLTAAAPEGPPGNTSVKTYDFDVNTGQLTYLPGVTGKLVGTDTEGTALVFVRPEGNSTPAELDLWQAGPAGGSVTPVARLAEGEDVEPVRLSSDGSVVVFFASGLPGFNDAATREIFRYDAATNQLGCVSCVPAGVAPVSASMSVRREEEEEIHFSSLGVVDERGMSADGDRVFFQTVAPLVPQDVNTGSTVPGLEHAGFVSQGVDVYEWENGVVYLISTGRSPRDSYFLDSSESGNDVFFATTEGLVPADTDGGYSVYDARVPRPGDNPSPAAVPCEGAVCQGPPNVPSPLTLPASATFSGLGNPTPEVTPPSPPAKATTKTVKCRNGFRRDEKNNKCVKNVRHERKKNRRSKK
jgi:hypothetical protein